MGCRLSRLIKFRASPGFAEEVKGAAAASQQTESEFCREAIRQHIKTQARTALHGVMCHFGSPGYGAALAAAEPQCREAARVGDYGERFDLGGLLVSLGTFNAERSPAMARAFLDEALSLFEALAADPDAHDEGRMATHWAATVRDELNRLGAVPA